MFLFLALVAFIIAGVFAAVDRVKWALVSICVGLILEIADNVHLG